MVRMFFPDKDLISPTGPALLLELLKEFLHPHMQKDIL